MRTLIRRKQEPTFEHPVFTRRGLTVLVDTGYYTPNDFGVFAGSRMTRRQTGMLLLGWDASGEHAAFIEAPHGHGCDLLLKTEFELSDGDHEQAQRNATVSAPCRIVATKRVNADRRLPPVITISDRVATIAHPVLSQGRVVRRVPYRKAGIQITVRDLDAKTVATLTTDRDGQVKLPPATVDRPNALIAAGFPAIYAVDKGR
jgi:hypothetical protein